jgi:hypothetical protein
VKSSLSRAVGCSKAWSLVAVEKLDRFELHSCQLQVQHVVLENQNELAEQLCPTAATPSPMRDCCRRITQVAPAGSTMSRAEQTERMLHQRVGRRETDGTSSTGVRLPSSGDRSSIPLERDWEWRRGPPSASH